MAKSCFICGRPIGDNVARCEDCRKENSWIPGTNPDKKPEPLKRLGWLKHGTQKS